MLYASSSGVSIAMTAAGPGLKRCQRVTPTASKERPAALCDVVIMHARCRRSLSETLFRVSDRTTSRTVPVSTAAKTPPNGPRPPGGLPFLHVTPIATAPCPVAARVVSRVVFHG